MGFVSRNILFIVSPSLLVSSSVLPEEAEKGEAACAFHCWSSWVWREGGGEGGREGGRVAGNVLLSYLEASHITLWGGREGGREGGTYTYLHLPLEEAHRLVLEGKRDSSDALVKGNQVVGEQPEVVGVDDGG